MTNLQQFLTMLATSNHDFTKTTGQNGIVYIDISDKGIRLSFCKDGMFKAIYQNNS